MPLAAESPVSFDMEKISERREAADVGAGEERGCRWRIYSASYVCPPYALFYGVIVIAVAGRRQCIT